MRFDSMAIHAGQPAEPVTGAVTVPIFQTTTYVQKRPGEHSGFAYSRTKNPTRSALETCLASLEGAASGFAFASGCAAASTVLSCLRSGDHIVTGEDIYGGTRRLFSQVLAELGLSFSYVDLSDAGALEGALRDETRLVWLETPTNPLMRITDIAATAEICRSANATLVVDNTFMTPYFQRPLELGADLVVHSTTKYINGHSDVLGGFVATNDKDWAERLAFRQNSIGAVPSPFDCFLVLRGLKTLGVRMRQHAQNAQAIAEFLQAHPAVNHVIYPGLDSHPQHALAKRQMSGFGGMITAELRGSLERVGDILSRTRLFRLAESLGAVESLVGHPAIMTHAVLSPEVRQGLGITDGLVRFSVGLEHVEDLIADLEAAFDTGGTRQG